MEVFLVLKYKLALLPIWEPSNFVLFKIPILMKYCIYNVSLKGSLQWQLKWTCILQFSISPSKAVSCLKHAKLRAQPAACTMWPCGSCQPLLCCHRGSNPKVSFSFLFSLKEHLVLPPPENVTSVPVLNPSPVSVLIIKTDGAVEVLLQLLLYFLISAFRYDHDWARQ